MAYRLHMWHWNWNGTGLNPLTADWFGVPFGNFFGWQMVVFFYSSISRIMERAFLHQTKARTLKFALVPLISVLLSQVFLYVMLMYVDVFLRDQFGITALHRFVTFLIALIFYNGVGYAKKKDDRHRCLRYPGWFRFGFTYFSLAGFLSVGFTGKMYGLFWQPRQMHLLGIAIHMAGIRKVWVMKPLAITQK